MFAAELHTSIMHKITCAQTFKYGSDMLTVSLFIGDLLCAYFRSLNKGVRFRNSMKKTGNTVRRQHERLLMYACMCFMYTCLCMCAHKRQFICLIREICVDLRALCANSQRHGCTCRKKGEKHSKEVSAIINSNMR